MIYDFTELKLFVKKQFGSDPDSVNSKFKLFTQKLTREELDNNIEFNLEGIFFTDKNGKKYKGFLYIESGYSQRILLQAKTSIPKFHVVNCETIESQKKRKNFNGHYVFSNEKIEMEDRYDGLMKELIVCGNCVKINKSIHRGMTTSQYKENIIHNKEQESNFTESDLPKEIATNFWGYTQDWDETSKNYRIKKRFTCENCGINLNTNLANGYYLETHHIDGNPKNNDENNLQCLCVLCHANVDKFHFENYSRGSARQKLRDFIKLFEVELFTIGNIYLNKYKVEIPLPPKTSQLPPPPNP
jgi:hypothetical protein